MNFFQSVNQFAKPFVKSAAKAADPLTAAKAKFAQQADEQLKLIKDGKDKGFWFKKLGDGYVINLKNGAAVLKDCSFAVGTSADAIKLLEQAKGAATKGEFDELLKATLRAPRKTAEAVTTEQQPSAPAAATPAAGTSKNKRK